MRHLAHFRDTPHATDLYLGERYGFRLFARDGFNYITGGGGIVFARPLIERLAGACVCPSASAPDDMIVGMCLRQLGIEPVHSERFHQARPADYAADLLATSVPISFHKFWQLDPWATYERWLGGRQGFYRRDADENNGAPTEENHGDGEDESCHRRPAMDIIKTAEQIKTATQHWEL